MTPERYKRIKEVVEHRQFDLTVLLENVHDPHNIGAVLRSCDSVGVQEIFILYTDPDLSEDRIKVPARSSSGARRWLKINYYTDLEACVKAIRERYDLLYSTNLSSDTTDLYDLDLSLSMALVFGNEHSGVSKLLGNHCDGNFRIPQVGMVQSLNISVACAVALYEAFRQRKNLIRESDKNYQLKKAELLECFVDIHESKDKKKYSRKINP